MQCQWSPGYPHISAKIPTFREQSPGTGTQTGLRIACVQLPRGAWDANGKSSVSCVVPTLSPTHSKVSAHSCRYCCRRRARSNRAPLSRVSSRSRSHSVRSCSRWAFGKRGETAQTPHLPRAAGAGAHSPGGQGGWIKMSSARALTAPQAFTGGNRHARE